MNEKAGTATRRRPPAPRAAPDSERHANEQRGGQPAGVDLPLVGHVAYTSLGFWTGLGVAGIAGVIDWPVVAAVGIGYTLARR
jgi:hypothetical protein